MENQANVPNNVGQTKPVNSKYPLTMRNLRERKEKEKQSERGLFGRTFNWFKGKPTQKEENEENEENEEIKKNEERKKKARANIQAMKLELNNLEKRSTDIWQATSKNFDKNPNENFGENPKKMGGRKSRRKSKRKSRRKLLKSRRVRV